MADNKQNAHCLYCEQSDDETPLIPVLYQGEDLWICPAHLPILIHKPAQLAGKLPGAAKLEPAEHDHH